MFVQLFFSFLHTLPYVFFAKVRDPGGNEDVVRRVCDMGFPEAQARRALASNDWDEMAAINALLSGS